MSHDQKPGKMRVVGNSAGRRRDDVAPISAAAAPVAGPAPGSDAPEAARKPVLLLAILFVVGCALGGAAMSLLGVL